MDEQATESVFQNRVFTLLWVATVLPNTGTWRHDVGASRLMTTLSPSPLTVAQVQTATSLPIFLFALPAGALADMMDKRKLLLAAHTARVSHFIAVSLDPSP